MNSIDSKTSEFRFTGWHMLACMVAFFGVIIAVNITMAFMASGTWTGLVVKNSYVASQKFNGELKHAQQQADSGLRSTISYASGELSVQISERDGTGIRPSKAILWIGRPAFEQQDRTLESTCQNNGTCTAKAQLTSGQWAIRFEASLDNGTYRRDARLLVNAGGKVEVD